VRPDCVTIGVAFAPQIVDELPLEPHDVALDMVVTDCDAGDRP
jgi:5-formyltetrahydrofolate cyclo-ligase